MVDTAWLKSVIDIKPLKAAETVSRNVRLVIYAYLDTPQIIFTIGRLCTSERKRMIQSYIANQFRSWRFDLDMFDPRDIAGKGNATLFNRCQFILQVVFEAELHLSTAHGMESLTQFIREMPEQFEREKISIVMERLGLETVQRHVCTIRELRPSLTFKALSFGEEPLPAHLPPNAVHNRVGQQSTAIELREQLKQTREITFTNIVFANPEPQPSQALLDVPMTDEQEEESKGASAGSPRVTSPRATSTSLRQGSSSVTKFRLLSTGSVLEWGTDRFTSMNNLVTLTLQGHQNAIEFFGINLRNLKHLEIDLLDELRQLSPVNLPARTVLYKGRMIQTSGTALQGWNDYVVALFAERGHELHSLQKLVVRGGLSWRASQVLSLLANLDCFNRLKELVFDAGSTVQSLSEILMAIDQAASNASKCEVFRVSAPAVILDVDIAGLGRDELNKVLSKQRNSFFSAGELIQTQGYFDGVAAAPQPVKPTPAQIKQLKSTWSYQPNSQRAFDELLTASQTDESDKRIWLVSSQGSEEASMKVLMEAKRMVVQAKSFRASK